MSERTVGLLMAATTGVCWATLAIALRHAMQYASTGTIVWFRMLVAFVTLALFYGIKNPRQLKLLWSKPLILFAGLCLAANYFSYMRGLELTSASNAQIMIQMGPLTLLLVGIVHFKETPSRSQTLGVIASVLGFALFFWDQVINSLVHASVYIEGNIWILFASITWAIFASLQKGLKGNWTAQQFNMVIYGICLVSLWPTATMNELTTWTWPVWILMILCGVNTLIAYGAFAEALRRIPASHVSLIIAANPLLTILLVSSLSALHISWAQGEPIGWRGVLGAVFVVIGIALTVLRNPRALRQTQT
jgi:drug/metabolite transporter (DMT)-like permease